MHTGDVVACRDETGSGDARPEASYVPVLGRIAAGVPITAEEVVDDVFPLPKQIVGEGSLFLLKVVGDSMIDAAICDGDWVVVRQQPTAVNGDIVAHPRTGRPHLLIGDAVAPTESSIHPCTVRSSRQDPRWP